MKSNHLLAISQYFELFLCILKSPVSQIKRVVSQTEYLNAIELPLLLLRQLGTAQGRDDTVDKTKNLCIVKAKTIFAYILAYYLTPIFYMYCLICTNYYPPCKLLQNKHSLRL